MGSATFDPALPVAEEAWGIVVAGVGGTGVITIGQLLGMAAHIEGKGVVTQDAGGLAQYGLDKPQYSVTFAAGSARWSPSTNAARIPSDTATVPIAPASRPVPAAASGGWCWATGLSCCCC